MPIDAAYFWRAAVNGLLSTMVKCCIDQDIIAAATRAIMIGYWRSSSDEGNSRDDY